MWFVLVTILYTTYVGSRLIGGGPMSLEASWIFIFGHEDMLSVIYSIVWLRVYVIILIVCFMFLSMFWEHLDYYDVVCVYHVMFYLGCEICPIMCNYIKIIKIISEWTFSVIQYTYKIIVYFLGNNFFFSFINFSNDS